MKKTKLKKGDVVAFEFKEELALGYIICRGVCNPQRFIIKENECKVFDGAFKPSELTKIGKL